MTSARPLRIAVPRAGLIGARIARRLVDACLQGAEWNRGHGTAGTATKAVPGAGVEFTQLCDCAPAGACRRLHIVHPARRSNCERLGLHHWCQRCTIGFGQSKGPFALSEVKNGGVRRGCGEPREKQSELAVRPRHIGRSAADDPPDPNMQQSGPREPRAENRAGVGKHIASPSRWANAVRVE